jgi:hypothetical protein
VSKMSGMMVQKRRREVKNRSSNDVMRNGFLNRSDDEENKRASKTHS